MEKKIKETITIQPPNMQEADFEITGTSPLVIHRFSKKVKAQMLQKMVTGKASTSKKEVKRVGTDSMPLRSGTLQSGHAAWSGSK
jgi:hypothetical protein